MKIAILYKTDKEDVHEVDATEKEMGEILEVVSRVYQGEGCGYITIPTKDNKGVTMVNVSETKAIYVHLGDSN